MRDCVLLLILSASLQAQTPPAIDTSKAIDLTYDYDEKTIYWPTAKPFEFHRESWGMSAGGYWDSAGRYSANEPRGAHLGSPVRSAKADARPGHIPVYKER